MLEGLGTFDLVMMTNFVRTLLHSRANDAIWDIGPLRSKISMFHPISDFSKPQLSSRKPFTPLLDFSGGGPCHVFFHFWVVPKSWKKALVSS